MMSKGEVKTKIERAEPPASPGAATAHICIPEQFGNMDITSM